MQFSIAILAILCYNDYQKHFFLQFEIFFLQKDAGKGAIPL